MAPARCLEEAVFITKGSEGESEEPEGEEPEEKPGGEESGGKGPEVEKEGHSGPPSPVEPPAEAEAEAEAGGLYVPQSWGPASALWGCGPGWFTSCTCAVYKPARLAALRAERDAELEFVAARLAFLGADLLHLLFGYAWGEVPCI